MLDARLSNPGPAECRRTTRLRAVARENLMGATVTSSQVDERTPGGIPPATKSHVSAQRAAPVDVGNRIHVLMGVCHSAALAAWESLPPQALRCRHAGLSFARGSARERTPPRGAR